MPFIIPLTFTICIIKAYPAPALPLDVNINMIKQQLSKLAQPVDSVLITRGVGNKDWLVAAEPMFSYHVGVV